MVARIRLTAPERAPFGISESGDVFAGGLVTNHVDSSLARIGKTETFPASVVAWKLYLATYVIVRFLLEDGDRLQRRSGCRRFPHQ